MKGNFPKLIGVLVALVMMLTYVAVVPTPAKAVGTLTATYIAAGVDTVIAGAALICRLAFDRSIGRDTIILQTWICTHRDHWRNRLHTLSGLAGLFALTLIGLAAYRPICPRRRYNLARGRTTAICIAGIGLWNGHWRPSNTFIVLTGLLAVACITITALQ